MSRLRSMGALRRPRATPAPELLGDAPDARADLYSLGAVLYELLTGREPALAADQQLAPPSRWRSDVPPGLDRLIVSMLAADREDRPSSAQAVLGELPASRRQPTWSR
jgi:eukaryotic-like serine/threonine-protein kinase